MIKMRAIGCVLLCVSLSLVEINGFASVRPVAYPRSIASAPACSSLVNKSRRLRHHSYDEIKMSTAGEVETEALDEMSEFEIDARDPMRRFRTATFVLLLAAIVGALSGWSVALFKLSIEAVREIVYNISSSASFLPLIPAIGGIFAGTLALPGDFPPGLRGSINEVDDYSRLTPKEQSQSKKRPLRYLRKTVASVFTLGTGNSLGPEGPAVEVGMSMSRGIMNVFPFDTPFGGSDSKASSRENTIRRNRLLLSCGAAAGVSAGFNAPLAGVFFALEIVQREFDENTKNSVINGATAPTSSPESPTSVSSNITAILIASVLSALVSRTILGDHLMFSLSDYTLRAPLAELPLYLGLGAVCGVAAFAFSQMAKIAQSFFEGELGPRPVRKAMSSLPRVTKPIIGGLFCGVIGIFFPQTLFFGYETLNALLSKTSLPTSVLLSLLGAKMVSTALAAASGLVGGTFAPSLFIGAMIGGSFHNILAYLLQFGVQDGVASAASDYILVLADVPAYAMVGAASMLASLFRAPLTGSLLLFELTRDYDVILPLMASAGVGSVIADIIEAKVEQGRVLELRRDRDSVSWGDLADKQEEVV